MKVNRNFTDFFMDRIIQAATEQSLLKFIEKLITLMDSSVDIYPDTFKNFMNVCVSDKSSARILMWVREYPNITAMLTTVKHEEREEIIKGIEFKEVEVSEGVALPRGIFDINITMSCTSPLSHGGDNKAGNATLFRRMNVLSTSGSVFSLPFYSGNSLRGIIRDLLADHFIHSLGMIPRRDKPPVNLWFFHCLYAGGALEENSKATKAIGAELGKDGILNTGGINRFRDMIPSLSLLGSALGNRIICGRVQFGDLRPDCKEWSTGMVPVGDLFDWHFLTRREDHEDHEKHHGMIATSEVLKAGTVLKGGINFDFHTSDIEKSVLNLGLDLLIKKGQIGAEGRRGLGNVAVMVDNNFTDSNLYTQYLAENKEIILQYLNNIQAIDYESDSTNF